MGLGAGVRGREIEESIDNTQYLQPVTCPLLKKDRLILAEYRLLIRDHISVGREKQIQKICGCFNFLNSLIFCQLFCGLSAPGDCNGLVSLYLEIIA